jgi:hypothetical protein
MSAGLDRHVKMVADPLELGVRHPGHAPAVRVGWQPKIRSAAWQKARTCATAAVPSVRSASSTPSPPVMRSYRFSIPRCLQDTRMFRCGMFSPGRPGQVLYVLHHTGADRPCGIVNTP